MSIACASRELGQDLLGLLGVAQPREHLDVDRVVLQPLAEGARQCCERQHCGRHQDRHLLLDEHRLEGCSQRDLGLAEPHVAAHQPIHGSLRLHVREHIGDGSVLIGCLVEGKLGLELAEEVVGSMEGMSGVSLAGGVDVEQLRRHLQQVFFDLALAGLPGGPAKLVEPDAVGVGAGELLDLAQLLDRQVELVRAVVVQQQEIAVDTPDRHARQPAIARDAVFDVDHQVAFIQIAEGGHEWLLEALWTYGL